jgi:hypothetical protein
MGYTMGRGVQITIGRGVKIPWVGGVDIPWLRGSKYHGWNSNSIITVIL